MSTKATKAAAAAKTTFPTITSLGLVWSLLRQQLACPNDRELCETGGKEGAHLESSLSLSHNQHLACRHIGIDMQIWPVNELLELLNAST